MTIFWLLIPSKVYNYDHPSRFLLTLWIFVLADEISYRSHALPHNLLIQKATSPVFFKLEVSLKPQFWSFEGNVILYGVALYCSKVYVQFCFKSLA